MSAYRAYVRSIFCCVNVTAVAAFPSLRSVAFEGVASFEVFQEFQVSLFMSCFNGSHTGKFYSQFMEAFFVGLCCHAVIHMDPVVTDDWMIDSTKECIAAAQSANAHSFIRRLPKGYDTVIAEDGGNISQGQKQLLCIARVMLCLPPMLILDEATSSIDTRTEVRIQAAFARMMQGRTSFIVAHRLSTIREADVILVMKDGHIVEQGDHDTLLAQGGFYAKLYNSQFEGVKT